MFNKLLIILVLVFLLLVISCEGPKGDTGPTGIQGQDGNNDKQIRIAFPSGVNTFETTWYTLEPAFDLFGFNIDNYGGVDSVILSVVTTMNNEEDTCFVQLFNLTDNLPIESSYIWSNNDESVRIMSGNIFNELPNKEIELTIRIHGSIGEYPNIVFATAPYLILYRQ